MGPIRHYKLKSSLPFIKLMLVGGGMQIILLLCRLRDPYAFVPGICPGVPAAA